MQPPATPQRTLRFFSILLLGGGAVYWLCLFGFQSLNAFTFAGIIIAAVAAFIPSINRAITIRVQQCNTALAARPAKVAMAAGVVVGVYLLIFALCSRDRLFLKLNDEHAYMIQARMLARGRLWMPAYPPNVTPFFDALGMIVDRVYAPMYFPGTALAMVPFVWLGMAFWVMPVVTASIAAGLLFRVFAELFDPVRGVLAVLLLASLHTFRGSAILLLAESPFIAAELLLLWAWLCFRRRPLKRWAILIGAAAGYAGITRPLDAVCFALPVGVAMLWQLRASVQMIASRVAIVLLGSSPFIALLLVQNFGVTGHVHELAEAYYNRENFPVSPMGFHKVDGENNYSNLNAVKRQWVRDWVLPSLQRHTPANALLSWYRGRLWQTLDNVLPNPILILLLPVGFLSLGEPRLRVLFAGLALFLAGYAVYLFFLEHYVVSILPPVICLILMGWETVRRAWSGRRINTFFLVALALIAAGATWPIAPMTPLPDPFAPDQRAATALLADLPITPAVVLFRFDPRVGSFHDDPVYNDGVAWPDDAKIVRARDLGPQKDRDIIAYYARHQPDRMFYIYDPDARAAGQNPLSPPLGTARDLDIRAFSIQP